jgi:hypothetical protein
MGLLIGDLPFGRAYISEVVQPFSQPTSLEMAVPGQTSKRLRTQFRIQDMTKRDPSDAQAWTSNHLVARSRAPNHTLAKVRSVWLLSTAEPPGLTGLDAIDNSVLASKSIRRNRSRLVTR